MLRRWIRPAVCLIVLLVVTAPAAGQAPGTASRPSARWQPQPTTAPWQWQLQGKIDTGVPAAVFDVDGFDVSAGVVARLHGMGHKVICYLDVGSWESYRPDADRFPRSALGRRYEGFPDERWLDIRHFHGFAALLRHRFDLCARKGFDAVEPDNLAGWENNTGFPISAADQLRFNRWVARRVHALGMAVALKNDGSQARALSPRFDFAIVEQCFQYEECDLYRGFVQEGKAVFEAEYELDPGGYCSTAQAIGFSAIGKSYDLFARPWLPCPPAPPTSRRTFPAGGTIVIHGADSGSHLTLERSGSNIVANGLMSRARPGGCRLGGDGAICPLEGAAAIEIVMGPNGDFVEVSNRLPLPLTVHLGAGEDKFVGNGEKDTCYGEGTRRNRCIGGAGDDVCITGPRNSDCVGGPGDDFCKASSGSDGCWGGPGRDVCYMGSGEDGCHGDSGNDRLFGGPDPDQLYGGPGFDYCDGGPGVGRSHDCEVGPGH